MFFCLFYFKIGGKNQIKLPKNNIYLNKIMFYIFI